ncbi:hypothetical protein HMPREF1981_00730 [Bacteroides pyogenes F0041]|uniref:Uncharacterized protein n=1 Tax=Bacteroides pyogenes F0041 TaxID=1321819 RepID=U2C935_9BACE|nr:hypothetical protein HMPREF1981_00730 [Bacteroides pyogenes F0041]
MAIDQKGNAVIKFFTRNSEDRYNFIIKVFNNGSTAD